MKQTEGKPQGKVSLIALFRYCNIMKELLMANKWEVQSFKFPLLSHFCVYELELKFEERQLK